MFGLKNRSINVRVVKEPISTGDNTETDRDIFEQVYVAAAYSDVAKDFITHAAVTIGGAFVVYKVIERLCR